MLLTDRTYPPFHSEGDEGQVLEFRDLSIVQRWECFPLPCARGSDSNVLVVGCNALR